MAVSDEELMVRTAQGDLRAFGDLFDRHHSRIFAFLSRLLGSRTQAEDVTQDVFWRVWQYRATWERRGCFVTWLYSVARHAGLDEIRARSRRATPLSELSPSGLLAADASPTDGGADPADRAVLREEVRRALLALPAEQRLCLILREYEGRTHAEIALILGCSEGNARVLTHRARSAMRALLRLSLESEESCV